MALIRRTYIRHTYNGYQSFLRLIIALAFILILAFTVTNFLRFYFLFEGALIPIILIIIIWGRRPERLQAGVYIIIYTVTASLPLLILLLYTFYTHNSLFFYFPYNSMPPLILFIMRVAMLVKFPLYGVHL